MTFREYLSKVEGFKQTTKTRREELRAGLYPIYQAVLAALGPKNKAIAPEDYIPTGPPEKKEPITDPGGLLKARFEKMNPHVNLKEFYDKRRARDNT